MWYATAALILALILGLLSASHSAGVYSVCTDWCYPVQVESANTSEAWCSCADGRKIAKR